MEKIVKMLVGSLVLSYILSLIIVISQSVNSKDVDLYIISLILISQTSITAPVLGFYFAINHNNERTQLNDDIVNQLIIKAHDKEEKERFNK